MFASHYDLFESLYGRLDCALAVVGQAALNIRYVNPALIKLFDRTKEVKPGLALDRFLISDSGKVLDSVLLARHSDNQKPIRCQYLKSPSTCLVRANILAIENQNYYLLQVEQRVAGQLPDTAAYQKLEEELRHTRDRFEDFALCGSDWFWETDAGLNIIEVSSQFTEQTGIQSGWLKGQNLIALLKDKEIVDAVTALRNGLPLRNVRLPVGDQDYWVSLSGRAVKGLDGQLTGYRGIGENIHDQVALEKALRIYQRNAEIMMDRAPAALGMLGQNGQFFYANDSFFKLLRADQGSLAEKYRELRELSRPDHGIFSSDDDDCSQSYEMVLETLDGPRFYSVLKYRLRRIDEQSLLLVTMVVDITHTRQQEVEQKKTEMVLDNIAEGILITDAEYRIVSANRSIQETTGYSLEELLGNTPALFSSGRYDRSFYQELWNQLHQSGQWRGDIWNRCQNGSVIRQHLSIQAILVNGEPQHYIGIYSSAWQAGSRRDFEQFAQQYDPLTSLPNRQLFQDRLHMACLRARVSRQSVEITQVRIGNMAELNSVHGHMAGDQILKKLAFHLEGCLSVDDTLARFSGDEFIMLRERGLDQTAENLVKAVLDQAIVLEDGSRVYPEFTIESVHYPDQGCNPQKLLRHFRRCV